jgi:hypothetical protein
VASVGCGACVGGSGVAAGLHAANTSEAMTSNANRIENRRFIFVSSPWGKIFLRKTGRYLDDTTFLTLRQGIFSPVLFNIWLGLCKLSKESFGSFAKIPHRLYRTLYILLVFQKLVKPVTNLL